MYLSLWSFLFFNDNSDNSDNGKNGRNALCHEVTYNKDNEITVANSFSLSTVLLNFRFKWIFIHQATNLLKFVIKDQPVRLY